MRYLWRLRGLRGLRRAVPMAAQLAGVPAYAADGRLPAGATPCLVFSRNRAPTYAVVPWEHLLALHARGGGATETAALPPRLAELLRELRAYAPADAPADAPIDVPIDAEVA